jgi:hypothetical protein
MTSVLPGELENSEFRTSSTAISTAEAQVNRRAILGSSAVLAIIPVLVISVYLLCPSLTPCLISIASFFYFIRKDYEAFNSLGPGGAPSGWVGYFRMNILRCFVLSDPYSPAPIIGTLRPPTGCFRSSQDMTLPRRSGPRPKVAGIAPQRQLNQSGSADAYVALRQALINASQQNPRLLRSGISCFEKRGLALFSRTSLNNTCDGEITHIHHSDRSMHMSLHPEDAQVVLEQGWGQRHPLAQGGWMERFVPKEFIMIYAPRDREELKVVARIVEAAAWWVAGVKIDVMVLQ